MVSINKAVVARYKKGKDVFEILVDCDKALEYRKGSKVDLMDVVVAENVFSDAKKALKVPNHKLIDVFESDDFNVVADLILKHGEIQVNKEHRDREREQKLSRIISIIHRNAVDSRTGLPHPPQRLKSAIEEAHVNVDMNKSAEQQIDIILDAIRPIIPIKFEVKKVELKIPSKFVSPVLTVVKQYGKINKECWMDNGEFYVSAELPAGLMEEFITDLNASSHGGVEVKIVEGKK